MWQKNLPLNSDHAGTDPTSSPPLPRGWGRLHRSCKHLGPCHAMFTSAIPQSCLVTSRLFRVMGIQKPNVPEYSFDSPSSPQGYFVFLVPWQKDLQESGWVGRGSGLTWRDILLWTLGVGCWGPGVEVRAGVPTPAQPEARVNAVSPP